MCAQLQSSSVVFHPGKRRLGTAPIIDRLCARIRSATFAKLGSATAAAQGCAGYRKPAATMPTDPHPGPRGSAHAETDLARVCDGFSHGLAMAEPQYRSDTRCTIVTRLWAHRAPLY